ncbi:MAG: methionine synthase [Ruminiclostridium sp.]|nr:methionine synthase [Ruminiclostridium sp.]
MMIDSIDKKEALRYLGINGKPDDNTKTLIDICERELLKSASPKFLFRIFEISDISENGIRLCDCNLILTGKAIARHLTGCKKAVLMCATLGGGADALIRKMQITDMARAVITDALASAFIEQVCDYAEGEIKKSAIGFSLTDRFSPGYDDLPIELQKDFLLLLDAQKKIGLCATDNMLLTPRKSVTAIIGLSEGKRDSVSRCDNCNLKASCQYRKDNVYCGK